MYIRYDESGKIQVFPCRVLLFKLQVFPEFQSPVRFEGPFQRMFPVFIMCTGYAQLRLNTGYTAGNCGSSKENIRSSVTICALRNAGQRKDNISIVTDRVKDCFIIEYIVLGPMVNRFIISRYLQRRSPVHLPNAKKPLFCWKEGFKSYKIVQIMC